MHLMHRPLEFAQSVGDLVGNIDPLTTYRRTEIHLNILGDCGISSNYFSTLYEMPTDFGSSKSLSVIVAFPEIIFQLFVKCRQIVGRRQGRR
jgi:hypothetical protein